MKLWHDDVRPAPAGWVHARTNEEAKRLFEAGEVEEASLDHDLGYDGPVPGPCPKCSGSGQAREIPTHELLAAGHPPEGPCFYCEGDGFVGGDLLYVAGTSEDDGTRLAQWLAERPALIPAKVTIHSWNYAGAGRMAEILCGAGATVVVRPYRV